MMTLRATLSTHAGTNERHSSTKAVNTTYTSVFRTFPYVTLGFKPNSLKPSEEFKNSIIDALKHTTDKSKKTALKKVFDMYGHVFQTDLEIGASITRTSSRTTSHDVRKSLCFRKLVMRDLLKHRRRKRTGKRQLAPSSKRLSRNSQPPQLEAMRVWAQAAISGKPASTATGGRLPKSGFVHHAKQLSKRD